MLTFCRMKISESEEHVDADEASRFTELETPAANCEATVAFPVAVLDHS